MSLQFYMDHNVHADITAGLRMRKIDCLTAAEDRRAAEDDDSLLDRAMLLKRAFVTGDQDFLPIAAAPLANGIRFTAIVYIRPLSVSVGDAIRDLELIAHGLLPEEHENFVQYIPL